MTHAKLWKDLAALASKTASAMALWAPLHVHALSTILAMEVTGVVTTVEASETRLTGAAVSMPRTHVHRTFAVVVARLGLAQIHH